MHPPQPPRGLLRTYSAQMEQCFDAVAMGDWERMESTSMPLFLAQQQQQAQQAQLLRAGPPGGGSTRRAPPRKSSSFNVAALQAAQQRWTMQQQHRFDQAARPYPALNQADALCAVHRRAPSDVAAAAVAAESQEQLLKLLMAKVNSLTAEKDAMAARLAAEKDAMAARLTAEKDVLAAHCTGLKSENQQLSGLVAALTDTLRQQQAHSKILLRLASNAGSTKACSSSDGGSGNSLPKHPAQQDVQVQDDGPVISCTLPVLNLPSGDGAVHQQGVGGQALPGAGVASVQLRSRHQRVAEWLRHERHAAAGSEEWTAWQQCLPLEPMSSSSSSSLQLALEDAMATAGAHTPAGEAQ